ncbi:hypothetical protein Pint_04021 [Pistacia integerrima]|uniref:Uncharacterized protein n=1 Tax=Pistacia integerrima TaxID=434235 RepID=A0ACC0Z106_9ROSI|nr:hypothetical protein Pint_04021 [Pistacia integerrima]
MPGFYSSDRTRVAATAIFHSSICHVGRQVAVAPGGFRASGGGVCVSDQRLAVLAATIEKCGDAKY